MGMKTPETKSPCVNTLPKLKTKRIRVPNEDLQQQRLEVKNKRRAEHGLPPIEKLL